MAGRAVGVRVRVCIAEWQSSSKLVLPSLVAVVRLRRHLLHLRLEPGMSAASSSWAPPAND
jgi:hypothetical protein